MVLEHLFYGKGLNKREFERLVCTIALIERELLFNKLFDREELVEVW